MKIQFFIYFFFWGGGGVGLGGGCLGRCERRSEVVVKLQKKIGVDRVWGSGRVGGAGQDGCERRIEVL